MTALPLDAGIGSIKQQLQTMRAAQAAKEQFAIQQLKLGMELESARACIEASKTSLTGALTAIKFEQASEAIVAIVSAAMRWFAAGGR